MKTLILDKADGIATITLNRPDRLNALNEQLGVEFGAALSAVAGDDQVRVIVITGAGKAFCAGGDFSYGDVKAGKIPLSKVQGAGVLYRDVRSGRLPPQSSSMFLDLLKLEKPTIAMVNGDAVGGGLDLALCCDMRIGSADARFSVGYARIGLTPDTGATWLLPRIVGLGRALEMILASEFYSAEEAYRLGLLNKVVTPQKLERYTRALAAKLAEGPPIAHRLSKLQVYEGLGMDFETAMAAASAYLNLTALSQDHLEGIKAFVEKRKPSFEGK